MSNELGSKQIILTCASSRAIPPLALISWQKESSATQEMPLSLSGCDGNQKERDEMCKREQRRQSWHPFLLVCTLTIDLEGARLIGIESVKGTPRTASPDISAGTLKALPAPENPSKLRSLFETVYEVEEVDDKVEIKR